MTVQLSDIQYYLKKDVWNEILIGDILSDKLMVYHICGYFTTH